MWEAYVALSHTTPAGFGRSPISYLEIEAFIRTTAACLSPWDVRLIRRLDDAAIAVAAALADTSGAIPASKGKEVAAMLRGMKPRKKT